MPGKARIVIIASDHVGMKIINYVAFETLTPFFISVVTNLK